MYNTTMNTMFTNSNKSETFDTHRLLLNLADVIDFRRKVQYIALSNLSIYYAWKNIKKSHKNNKFKISAPIWTEEFELLDGSCSISDIQVYLEYVLKKTVNPSIRIYTNKTENRITFKIKTGYLELLTPETMKLFGNTKSKIAKDENSKNVPYLEINEVVLIHCDVANNSFQQNSRVYIPFFLINLSVNY